ncbi:MAG: hypothetical protein PVS2B2_18910 [Candidatus Acidiferrum sp.]
MSDIAVGMRHVFKKFRKGELHDSLRDLIPAWTGRLLGWNPVNSGVRRDFWALQDVSFEVHKGEAFGIVGANGAGKSTILKLISRIMEPTSGSVEISGRLSALIEVSAGFHPDLTGRDNIYLNGTILGMNRKEIAEKFDEIVEFSGLSEFLDTPVKRYSSGMYARLGFSVAAHVKPDVLIVDEVLSVGDYVFQQKCMERMREIIREGTTILFVSHNLKAVTELCERAMLLRQGKVAEIGSTDTVIRRYMNDALKPGDVDTKKIYVSQVRVRDQSGEQSTFESGDTAFVDIVVAARADIENIAVLLWVTDQTQYILFNTSTERLGYPPFSLKAGESHRCTFELKLNMAHGEFHICTGIYRYDIQKEYDSKAPASTIFVGSNLAVRGAVNCFPKLVASETFLPNSKVECKA